MKRDFSMKRRTFVAGALSLPLVTVLKHPASAAEFNLKYATGQTRPTRSTSARRRPSTESARRPPGVSISSFIRLTSSAPTPTCWHRFATVPSTSSICPRWFLRPLFRPAASPASASLSRTTIRSGRRWMVILARILPRRLPRRRSSRFRASGTTASGR